jgi:hypothetical protein
VIDIHTVNIHHTITVNTEGFATVEYNFPTVVFDKEEPAQSVAAKAGS